MRRAKRPLSQGAFAAGPRFEVFSLRCEVGIR